MTDTFEELEFGSEMGMQYMMEIWNAVEKLNYGLSCWAVFKIGDSEWYAEPSSPAQTKSRKESPYSFTFDSENLSRQEAVRRREKLTQLSWARKAKARKRQGITLED